MIGKIAADKLFKRLDSIESGTLKVTTPDGKTRIFSGRNPGENAHIELRDWRVIGNLATRGDIGFAEDYRAGFWEADDLPALATLGLVNKSALDPFLAGSTISRTVSMLSYLMRINTLRGSKRNIHDHYDLGNDFYSLWLDPSMTYSSALYRNDVDTLEQAQMNKYDRILDCLNKDSGSIIEIGCGWGGFAERASAKGDYSIRGITLSEEQKSYADKRLGNKAQIALEDYRHQSGKFDNIVSIEMFEAVGEAYWRTYFGKISSLMNQGGKAVIQTITMNERDFNRYRRGGDFIRSYIFPGGMLPSPSRFETEATNSGLHVGNHYFFGQDYARTLLEWLVAFDSRKNDIKKLGFDDGFIRLWRFYLATCAAGFKSGHTNVMQVELSHA